MKKFFAFVLVLAFATALLAGTCTTALAMEQNDSITTSLRVSPLSLPGEGNVSISVTIKNNGNPITNVRLKYPSPTDTIITLGDMTTGESKTHDNAEWFIHAEMLDQNVSFTVMWVSADGTEKSGDTQAFTIQKQDLSIKVSGSATVNKTQADKGDKVEFKFSLKNEGNVPIENCKLTAPNLNSGQQIGDTFSLEPGSVNNKTNTVTVVENLNVTPTYTYEVDGQSYTYKMDALAVTMTEPTKTIAMSATLNADKTDIASGDEVKFTVTITNTGTSNLDGVKVQDFDGNAVPVRLASLAPGQSTTGEATIKVANSGSYQFAVSAVGAGGEAVNHSTNQVSINAGGTPTSDPGDVINPDNIIKTDVHISTMLLSEGPGEVVVTATVTNLTDQELKNVIVLNELIGTIGTVPLLGGGEVKEFSRTFTAEETAEYAFTTTAELPDGKLIESKTNSATITVVEGSKSMDPTMLGFIIIIIAIAAVGVALGIYLYRSRKKAMEKNQAYEERRAQRYPNATPSQQSTTGSRSQRSRAMGEKSDYPDRSLYSNRTPQPRVETVEHPRNAQQEQGETRPVPRAEPPRAQQPQPQQPPPKKADTNFGDRNKF